MLYEDEHLLALDKPARLLTSPDRYDPSRPNLMALVHLGIRRGAPWARERALTYLANAHRLDFETTGVLLLAKSKPVLRALADQFGAGKPFKTYDAIVLGRPVEKAFRVDAPLAPHPRRLGEMRVDEKRGKKSVTEFELAEAFSAWSLLRCRPLTGRTHQLRVHLQHAGLPMVGDALYGGRRLCLSEMKKDYRPGRNGTERPLIDRVALHAAELTIVHPVTETRVTITSPWPKDFAVSVKYLRRFAAGARA